MRQVTGSNPSTSVFRVSIQQSLDGHSFSHPRLDECANSDKPVEVELLLPHSLLVPNTLYRKENEAELFAASGMPLAQNETVIACSSRSHGVVLVAMEAEMQKQLREKFPNARYASPLESVPQNTENTIWIAKKSRLLYIKVYRTGILRLAEVIPADSEAEIGYFLQRLDQLFPLKEFCLQITGEEPKQLKKWFGKAFNKVSCE